MMRREVATAEALRDAAADEAVPHIVVAGDLVDLPMLRLPPGKTLTGRADGARLRFAPGEDGVQLTTDNDVANLDLRTDPDRRVVFNDTGVASLGRLLLRGLSVTGMIRLLAADQVRGGHVAMESIDILAADARGVADRPKGYGVEVVAGVVTLWNQQHDPSVTLTADLLGIAAGRAGAPVRGGGVFVGGQMRVSRLETAEIHSDGGIVPGTHDRIAGGVFVVSGTTVRSVRNRGPVTTYGANDMVLDNWGSVDRWVADAAITSHGPSGIGVVNFGRIDTLDIAAPVETFGVGARGFNVYAGTVRAATFDRVVTHGDGAVGIQIGRPVGGIVVRRGIETFGGSGDSLVEGVIVQLPATGFSVKPDGTARRVTIGGGVRCHGAGVAALELHGTI
ncbi:MAG: hypothetical protein HIU92_19935, partial [Proteobacteria bacterium]|nr:hypothetical protein [Pseudomonadota bacterium]